MPELSAAPLADGSAPRWLRQLIPPERSWHILQRAGHDGPPAPLGSDLVRLTGHIAASDTAWVARVVGRDEDVAYLREALASVNPAVTWTEAPVGGWRRSEAVVCLAAVDPARSVLLRGEGASDYTVLLLLCAQTDAAELAAMLHDGHDDAAMSRARLAVAYRPGDAWAAVSWPSGAAPPWGSIVAVEDTAARPLGIAASQPAKRLGIATIVALAVTAAIVGVASRDSGSGPRQPVGIATTAPSPTAAPVPPAPMARQLAASAYDPDGDVTVLFGGIATGGSGRVLGDTWTWNGRGWSQQTPSDAIGFRTDAPAGRYGAAMAYAPGAHGVVLFGGTARSPVVGPLQDTWVWDRTRWRRLDVSGPPSTAVAVAMSYDLSAGDLVLVTAAQDHPEQLQTWTWDGELGGVPAPGEMTWTPHADAGTPPIHLMAPDPRGGHLIAVTSTRSGPGEEPTWRWNGQRWLPLQPRSAVVVESISATITDDLSSGTVVLVEEQFIDQSGEDRGGTWTWDGATWSHHAGSVPDVVHAFDVAQPVWFPRSVGVDIVGGPRQGDSYDASWFWDGLVWSETSSPLTATQPPSP
jgi:hypothetical protein